MVSALITALIVATIGPTVTAFWAERRRTKDAEEAARLAAIVAMKVSEVKHTLTDTSAKADAKLDVIHNLVNSQLTQAVERLNAAMKEVAAIKARYEDTELDKGEF
jgi:hypothetical protein